MKEYQFKIGNAWIDVHARTATEAVSILNGQLHLLDEPLSAPGLIRRICLDIRRDVTADDIVQAYDFDRCAYA
jgi:hypothetical protein